MKIAVTHENGRVFQHFGHTKEFKVYMVEDGKVLANAVVDANGSGHGALADFLSSIGVSTLICGGIGMGAQLALDNADIELYAGIEGDADEAVAALLAGTLAHNGAANCNHHHDHDHSCSCGHEHHEHDHDCHCHEH